MEERERERKRGAYLEHDGGSGLQRERRRVEPRREGDAVQRERWVCRERYGYAGEREILAEGVMLRLSRIWKE